jgi:broad specificity phosphatase PhoE
MNNIETKISNDETIIYFVRHGQTDDNKSRNWGSPDSTPLNDDGIWEALQVGDELAGIEFDMVIFSLTKRTHQTAYYVLLGKINRPKIIIDTALREMFLGSLPNLTPEGIVKSYGDVTKYPSEESKLQCPKIWKKRRGIPLSADDANDCYLDKWCDAETFQQSKRRTNHFLVEIAANYPGKKILVVGHSTGLKGAMRKAYRHPGTGKKLPFSAYKPETSSWVQLQVSQHTFKYIYSRRIRISTL